MTNQTDNFDKSELIVVGRLGSSYGVQGWSKLNSYTDPRTNIVNFKNLYISSQGHWQKSAIDGIKIHGNHVLIKLKGCESPEVAKTYSGTDVAVMKDQLPTLEKGEYYWSDLIGCKVSTVDGQLLGNVDYLLETGANDVLVIKGERERLIPFLVGQFITNVDIKNKSITVDWDPEF